MIGVAYSIIHISTSNPPGRQIRIRDGNENGMREIKIHMRKDMHQYLNSLLISVIEFCQNGKSKQHEY